MSAFDSAVEHAVWKIEKFRDVVDFRKSQPFKVIEFEGNLLLNEGINELWNMAAGDESGNFFDNTNAHLGVGDSDAAASASQTGLQAAVNKLYKGMEAAYPMYGSNQQIIFQAVFEAADANFDWNEFTVANGDSDAAVNLNRKVAAQGTKASPQVWTLTLTLTLT